MNKVRMKATMVVYYDADPKDYPSSDPHQMARVDRENLLEYPNELPEYGDVELIIEPVGQ